MKDDIFRWGEFTLHSGEVTPFKIDLDGLSNDEVDALYNLLAMKLPLFRWVEGVPRGGIRFAEAMKRFATRDSRDSLLIVDDVLTSGASMEEHRAGREAIGAVIFSRAPAGCETLNWVMPLFRM